MFKIIFSVVILLTMVTTQAMDVTQNNSLHHEITSYLSKKIGTIEPKKWVRQILEGAGEHEEKQLECLQNAASLIATQVRMCQSLHNLSICIEQLNKLQEQCLFKNSFFSAVKICTPDVMSGLNIIKDKDRLVEEENEKAILLVNDPEAIYCGLKLHNFMSGLLSLSDIIYFDLLCDYYRKIANSKQAHDLISIIQHTQYSYQFAWFISEGLPALVRAKDFDQISILSLHSKVFSPYLGKAGNTVLVTSTHGIALFKLAHILIQRYLNDGVGDNWLKVKITPELYSLKNTIQLLYDDMSKHIDWYNNVYAELKKQVSNRCGNDAHRMNTYWCINLQVLKLAQFTWEKYNEHDSTTSAPLPEKLVFGLDQQALHNDPIKEIAERLVNSLQHKAQDKSVTDALEEMQGVINSSNSDDSFGSMECSSNNNTVQVQKNNEYVSNTLQQQNESVTKSLPVNKKKQTIYYKPTKKAHEYLSNKFFNYHDRVIKWFDSKFIKDKKFGEVLYHSFSPLVDQYAIECGKKMQYRSGEMSYQLPGEIHINNQSFCVLFTWTIDKEGVCYHRGIEMTTDLFGAWSKVWKSSQLPDTEQTACRILCEKFPKQAVIVEQKNDGVTTNNKLYAKIVDNRLQVDIILYKANDR